MKLRDCPFCGSEGKLQKTLDTLDKQHSAVTWRVECLNVECGGMVLRHKDEQRARDAWNRRVLKYGRVEPT